jgi:hypothetical protein
MIAGVREVCFAAIIESVGLSSPNSRERLRKSRWWLPDSALEA